MPSENFREIRIEKIKLYLVLIVFYVYIYTKVLCIFERRVAEVGIFYVKCKVILKLFLIGHP